MTRNARDGRSGGDRVGAGPGGGSRPRAWPEGRGRAGGTEGNRGRAGEPGARRRVGRPGGDLRGGGRAGGGAGRGPGGGRGAEGRGEVLVGWDLGRDLGRGGEVSLPSVNGEGRPGGPCRGRGGPGGGALGAPQGEVGCWGQSRGPAWAGGSRPLGRAGSGCGRRCGAGPFGAAPRVGEASLALPPSLCWPAASPGAQPSSCSSGRVRTRRGEGI